MSTHEWTDRLSEYLDDELDATERAALERHLDACAECAQVLAELRAVVTAARALPEPGPARDLWAGIEARIRSPHVVSIGARRSGWTSRSFSFSMPQLAAAAAAGLLIAGAASLALYSTGGPDGAAPVQQQAEAQRDPSAAAFAAAFPTEYDGAVSELEAFLQAGRDRLDPATIAVVEENLRIIDRALAESREALAQDPSNEFLTHYLAESMRRKLRLLRQATEIVRAES